MSGDHILNVWNNSLNFYRKSIIYVANFCYGMPMECWIVEKRKMMLLLAGVRPLTGPQYTSTLYACRYCA